MPPVIRTCRACQTETPLFPFTMAFQPIVDVSERSIHAHEALVRGVQGEGAAETLAQLTEANIYAFDQACRVKAIDMAASLGLKQHLHINFLPNAVYEPRACIRATLEAAERTGIAPEQLTFEITENETITDTGHLLAIIAEYRRQGFLIALDDMGTGWSGLSRLADLKPDILKLDRALVQDCDKDRVRLAIIRNMIRLGDEIGMQVVLEGVETAAEMQALVDVGGRYMQGFHFARPVLGGIATEEQIFPGAVG